MEGYLGKKGKRMGSRVKRYMRLEGALLSNRHHRGTKPSWQVNIKHATISINSKKHRISLELYNNKLELYADSSDECERWYQALCNAKSTALAADMEGRENGNAEPNENRIINMNSCTIDSSIEQKEGPDKEAKECVDLGKNFKVVKPLIPTRAGASSDSDEAYEGDQPLVVQGQAYEETPASMIFKQFNFPGK